MRVVCLAGGVGGAKLADGLQQVLASGELTVVVNTGDDFERHSLLVCPDHDTVAYTLAGLADPVQGWGIAGETWHVSETLTALGEDEWFRLGDRDLATHLYRTERYHGGVRLTEIQLALQAALGVPSRILPMTDEAMRTQVETDDGWIDFQDYFVRLRQEPVVRAVRFQGEDRARPTPEVTEALESADVIVIAPSNPVVSIGPILAVPGMVSLIAGAQRRDVPVVGVSGIVAGRALRGPADRMLESLGEESSAAGVANAYRGLADRFVIDKQDEVLAQRIRDLDMEVLVTDTIMSDREARARLAREVLAFSEPSTGTGLGG